MDKSEPPGIIYKVILSNDPGPQMEMPGRKGQRFKLHTKKYYYRKKIKISYHLWIKVRTPGMIYKVILSADPGPQREMPGIKWQRFKSLTKNTF